MPTSGVPIRQLPFQVRPRSGEGGRTFITRLAEANHLTPGYLRTFLTDPPQRRGTPSWDRLAAVTGRDPVQLRRILETTQCSECGAPMTPMSSFGVKPRTCSTNCRQRSRTTTSHYRRTAPCRVCGKPMDYRIGQRRYLCSSDCRRFAFECRRRGQLLPRRSEGDADGEDPLAEICPGCGEYLPQPRTRRACSRRCTRRTRRWIRTPMPPPTPCTQCGGLVFALADGRPRTLCSEKCRQHAEEAERERAIAEALAEGTRTCRGCGDRYKPRRLNPWCSEACLAKHIDQCRNDPKKCPVCGVSIASRPRGMSGRTRQWCSPNCCHQAFRWRAEFRDRSLLPPLPLSRQARQTLSRNRYGGDAVTRTGPTGDQYIDPIIDLVSDHHEARTAVPPES